MGPPAYHIRRSRLLYLGRLFIHGPPELLGVITASLHSYLFANYTYSWLASLHQDLIWISARCPHFEPFKELSLLEILHSMEFRMWLVRIHGRNTSKLFSKTYLTIGNLPPNFTLLSSP